MVLAAHSNASFLSKPKSHSCAGGHIFLSEDDPIPRTNGPLLSITQVMRSVYASASEAETGALYIVAQEMVPLRNMLTEMGWKQPRLFIQINNSATTGYVNKTIVMKRLKEIEMRLDWLRCQEAQGQFRFFWDKGTHNTT